ncbi:MAG: GntR family transcriptional regulator [Anaerococcus sp.]|jgi:GntR family transcriptional regulator|nr:GntR family transcriptional regulator [Peptoniphilaceae bacterium]MDY3055863.1 GntR family transcriptional regulator [Anaerococcus sp.]
MVIEIDLNSKVPIYEQIADKIIGLIAKGDLVEGDRLPSVRNLADICGINPMTANKAYKILEEASYITINKRSGAVVRKKDKASDADIESFRLTLSRLLASGMGPCEIRKLLDESLEDLL